MTKTEMETAFLFRLQEMVSLDMLYLGEVWLGGAVSGRGPQWAMLVIGLLNALCLGVKRRGIFEGLELTTGCLDF